MKERELQGFITEGLISSVCLYRDHSRSPKWSLYAYGAPAFVGELLTAARGQPRQFVSLDTAVAFLRTLGWHDSILLDESRQMGASL